MQNTLPRLLCLVPNPDERQRLNQELAGEFLLLMASNPEEAANSCSSA